MTACPCGRAARCSYRAAWFGRRRLACSRLCAHRGPGRWWLPILGPGPGGRRRSFGPEVVADVPLSTVGLLRRGLAECDRLPLSKCRPRTSGTGRTWPSHPGRRDAGTPGARGRRRRRRTSGQRRSRVTGSPPSSADGAERLLTGRRRHTARVTDQVTQPARPMRSLRRGHRPRGSRTTLTSGRWPPGARPRGTVPTRRLRTRRPARASLRRPPCRHRLPRRARGR